MTDSRQRELGDFLRSRRERLDGTHFGLLQGGTRRTPGLRREEVAELAGISVDWYVRLEQGRAVTPSLTTLDGLAIALRLTEVERDHLRQLSQSLGSEALGREHVPETLLRVLATLSHPAYVTGRRWDVLAWNAGAADLFPEFERADDDRRNILIYMFTERGARELFADGWPGESRRILGLFRSTFDLHSDDTMFCHLVHRLQSDSPEFSAWWNAHDIAGPPTSRIKRLHHPRRGEIAFETTSLQSNDDPGLKLAIYLPIENVR